VGGSCLGKRDPEQFFFFLMIGVTAGVLKAKGTVPRDNEELERLER